MLSKDCHLGRNFPILIFKRFKTCIFSAPSIAPRIPTSGMTAWTALFKPSNTELELIKLDKLILANLWGTNASNCTPRNLTKESSAQINSIISCLNARLFFVRPIHEVTKKLLNDFYSLKILLSLSILNPQVFETFNAFLFLNENKTFLNNAD